LEPRPQIVCLCGSTRYAMELRAANRELTLAGAIVLAPAEFERAELEPTEPVGPGRSVAPAWPARPGTPAGPGSPSRPEQPGDQSAGGQRTSTQRAGTQITDEQKAVLGTLHLAKIDLADCVLVVNPGGYVGESTRREIRYAHQAGKPVEYTDPPGSVADPDSAVDP
jgi:hypothetical protein